VRITASRPRCDTRIYRLRSGSTDHRTESLGGGGLLYVFCNTRATSFNVLPLNYSRFSLFILFFKFHATGCFGHIIPLFFGWYVANFFFNLLGNKITVKMYPFCNDSEVMAIVFIKKNVSTLVNNCPTRCEYVQFIIFLQTALHVSGGNSTHHQEHR
jgi:hypothetical protein